MGIEVLPPDVHAATSSSPSRATRIRFGLLAVKNVGQGAIESIIAARDDGGPFRSLTDFCTRIDLRLTNRKVLESLAKVGALSPFGHPAQVITRPRRCGRLRPGDPARPDHRPDLDVRHGRRRRGVARAPAADRRPEAPVRERLRWEKELLGLYLSEHPMGEVADQVGDFVTAYSGDLRDESLDGQRLVVGGIVTGVRTVVTQGQGHDGGGHARGPPGIARGRGLPEAVRADADHLADGSILLVAGRVDHRGEDVSLLADLVISWDDAVARRRRGVRSRRRGGRSRRVSPARRGCAGEGSANGNGTGYGNGGGYGNRDRIGPATRAGRHGAGGARLQAAGRPARRADVPDVSPLRADAVPVATLPPISPAEPVPTYPDVTGVHRPRARTR